MNEYRMNEYREKVCNKCATEPECQHSNIEDCMRRDQETDGRTYKEALEDMVWQFAHRGIKNKRAILYTGGLSALEGAFSVLGWDNPKYFDDDYNGVFCDVEGCPGWVVAQGGMWADAGYWCLCSQHCQDARLGKPQPTMKARAIDRENSRDKETGILEKD